jgi:hypothetical protein
MKGSNYQIKIKINNHFPLCQFKQHIKNQLKEIWPIIMKLKWIDGGYVKTDGHIKM